MSGYVVYEEHVSGNCRVDSSETKPTDEEIQQLLSGVTGGCGQLNMLNGSRRGGARSCTDFSNNSHQVQPGYTRGNKLQAIQPDKCEKGLLSGYLCM